MLCWVLCVCHIYSTPQPLGRPALLASLLPASLTIGMPRNWSHSRGKVVSFADKNKKTHLTLHLLNPAQKNSLHSHPSAETNLPQNIIFSSSLPYVQAICVPQSILMHWVRGSGVQWAKQPSRKLRGVSSNSVLPPSLLADLQGSYINLSSPSIFFSLLIQGLQCLSKLKRNTDNVSLEFHKHLWNF